MCCRRWHAERRHLGHFGDDARVPRPPQSFDSARQSNDRVRSGQSRFWRLVIRLRLKAAEFGTDSKFDPANVFDDEVVQLRQLHTSSRVKLPEHVRHPEVVAIVPTNEAAFSNVYGKAPSLSAISELKRARRLFNTLDDSRSISSSTFGRSDLTTVIAKRFRCWGYAIKGMSWCSPVMEDFGIAGQLDLFDAYFMSAKGLRAAQDKPLTTMEFIGVVRAERHYRNAKKVMMIGAVAGATGEKVFLLTISSKHSD